LAQFLLDECEPHELDGEQLGDLVEQDARDGLGVSRPAQRAVDDLDGLELALEQTSLAAGPARTAPGERVPGEESNLACSTHRHVMIGPAARRRSRFRGI